MLIGVFDGVLMRIQLAVPRNTFLEPQTFDQTFTMHGSVLMYLFATPFLEGIATVVVPFMIGAREVPWPRLTAFVFWTFLIGSVLFESSWLLHYMKFFGLLPGYDIRTVPDAGWTAYVPLTEKSFSPQPGIDMWLLALTMASVGAIVASPVLIASMFKTRAPGMSINRIPLFIWSIIVMAFMMYFAFIPIFMGSMFLQFDRKFGTHFFDTNFGGSALLWQHLFWMFGHPDVYIQFVPAAGIISTILPVFTRQRITGYIYVAMALVLIGFISFGLWVHHMFTVGLPPLAMSFFAAASIVIAIPSGVQVASWAATIWRGQPRFNTPFLFIVGFFITFVLGGITGVMVAIVPFDWQVHDSYFVVAHFHYVLVGAVVFPIIAAVFYWFPKYMGRMLSDRLGRITFWLVFIGFNVTFFPQHILGLLGMPRRVYTYADDLGWNDLNLLSSLGVSLIVAGVLVMLFNLYYSLRHGEKATQNPWGADTLEWATDSPVPDYGFHKIPIVRSRHPLWDQQRLDEGDERTVKIVNTLAEWPTTMRVTLVTSTLEAEVEEAFRVAGPSAWPLIAVIGMSLIFVAFFFEDWLMAGLLGAGALIGVVALIGWHWPSSAEKSLKPEEIVRFEQEHGIPLYVRGSPTISWWGYGLVVLGLAIALATTIFSYFYLAFGDAPWPPPGIPMPDLRLPSIGSLALLISGVSVAAALRAIRRGQRTPFKLGLALTTLLGIVFVILQIVHDAQLTFTPTTHAYASIYWTLDIGASLFAVLGLLMLIGTLVFAWRGNYSAKQHQTVTNAAFFWAFVVVAWLAIFATIDLSPYAFR